LSHGSLGRFVLRFRWLIVGFWLVVLLAGGFAASKLTPLLSNTFTVLGADSERARSSRSISATAATASSSSSSGKQCC